MTYQATRPLGMNYGKVRTAYEKPNSRPKSAYETASSNRRPASAREGGISRDLSTEQARQAVRARAAERVRTERAEAERIYRLERKRAYIKACEERVKREQKAARAEAKRIAKAEAKREEDALRRREIKVEKQKLPIALILGIVTAFVLLMGVVYSFSQISESSLQLSEMKAHLAEVEAEADKVSLVIEEKNDLGEIERIATEELNMVKEGSVQKKYITVSDGDRIVLEATEEENTPGFFGSMLSSVSAVFDDLLDYFG